jgi:hypothetical protein
MKGINPMAQNLVIYVQGGQVRRVMADFEAGMNCLLVYTDVPAADQGQPWVREIEWPSRSAQEVLLEGIAVEFSPGEVRAVVQATEETRTQVRELFRDTDTPNPAITDGDETLRVKVYRWKQHDLTGSRDRGAIRFGTLEAIARLDRCTPILETEEEVDARRVDANGFLITGG